MGIDTQTMRRKLLKAIGEDEDDTTLHADAILLLNQSYWQILDTYPFREKEKTVRFSTVAGTINYNMPEPFEAVQSLSIEDLNSKQHSPLKKLDNEIYEERYINTDDARGKPEFYVREGCFAKFLPTPDDAYVIVLKYWTVLDDLNADDSRPGIPQSWHEIILYGGIWRGFLENGDHDRASSMRQHQQALINSAVPTEAKEERDTRFAGLQPFNYRAGVRLGRGVPRGRNGYDEF